MRSLRQVDSIVHQQIAEDDHTQEDDTRGVAQDHDDRAPARPEIGRVEKGVGEMEIGRRHKGDADPLKLEPPGGSFLGLDGIEDNIAGIDDHDEREQSAKGTGDPAAEVVRNEVDQQGERRQDNRRCQYLVD